MFEKPLKTVKKAIFYALIMALSGCVVEPVNLTVYVEDPAVIDIVEKGMGKVNITESDDGLVAGNQKITGLNPSKYYIIEEWDKSGTPVSVRFIAANGTRTQSFTGIGRVTGGAITGLTNDFNYRVRSARALTSGNINYDGGSGLVNLPIVNGSVPSITPPVISNPYIDLPSSIPASYEIVRINASNVTSAVSITTNITINAGTYSDFVCIEKDVNGDPILTPFTFNVLRINIPPVPPTTGDLKVTIGTITFTGANPPTVTYGIATFNSATNTLTIPVTSTGTYAAPVYTWYIDGNQAALNSASGSLTYVVGSNPNTTYNITLLVTDGGVLNSTTVQTTVSGITY